MAEGGYVVRASGGRGEQSTVGCLFIMPSKICLELPQSACCVTDPLVTRLCPSLSVDESGLDVPHVHLYGVYRADLRLDFGLVRCRDSVWIFSPVASIQDRFVTPFCPNQLTKRKGLDLLLIRFVCRGPVPACDTTFFVLR